MLHLPKRTKRETSTMAMKTEIEVPKSGSESPPPPQYKETNCLAIIYSERYLKFHGTFRSTKLGLFEINCLSHPAGIW